MRKDLGNKMQFLPLPVVVIGTYNKNGKANAMTAAWATVYDYGQVFVSVDMGHATADNLKENKAFTLAFSTKNTIKISDALGTVSGKQIDKISKLNLEVIESSKIKAPIFPIYPLVLECEVDSFENGNLIGKIVNVNIDSSYLNPDGTINSKKLELVVYDMSSNTYKIVGEDVAPAFVNKII